MRQAVLLAGVAAGLQLGQVGGVECLWSVNTHQFTGLFDSLTPEIKSRSVVGSRVAVCPGWLDPDSFEKICVGQRALTLETHFPLLAPDCPENFCASVYDTKLTNIPARSRMGRNITAVYGLGLTAGFITYPTDLFQMIPPATENGNSEVAENAQEQYFRSSRLSTSLPHPPTRVASQCSTEADTDTVETYFAKVSNVSVDDCCTACAANNRCTFATWHPTAATVQRGMKQRPTSSEAIGGPTAGSEATGGCWLKDNTTLTAKASPGTVLITVNGRPAPPPPPVVPWIVAWKHNLAQFPQMMAATAIRGLNGTKGPSLLMLDYEPPFRPSWNFSCLAGEGQPRWAALLSTVHKVRPFPYF